MTVKFVYLAVLEEFEDSSIRIICRGVFSSAEAAEKLTPLIKETTRNIVSVFEGQDMGYHIGVSVSSGVK